MAQRVGLQDAVAVDAHHDLAARVGDAVVQRVELSAVGLGEHAELDVGTAALKGQRAQERLVRRAVVDHDDFEARILHREQRLQHLADHRRFVEGRHDDRYEGHRHAARARRRRFLLAPVVVGGERERNQMAAGEQQQESEQHREDDAAHRPRVEIRAPACVVHGEIVHHHGEPGENRRDRDRN